MCVCAVMCVNGIYMGEIYMRGIFFNSSQRDVPKMNDKKTVTIKDQRIARQEEIIQQCVTLQ